jgi:hypothetical protein
MSEIIAQVPWPYIYSMVMTVFRTEFVKWTHNGESCPSACLKECGVVARNWFQLSRVRTVAGSCERVDKPSRSVKAGNVLSSCAVISSTIKTLPDGVSTSSGVKRVEGGGLSVAVVKLYSYALKLHLSRGPTTIELTSWSRFLLEKPIVDLRAAGQEIPRLLWNPKVYYCS